MVIVGLLAFFFALCYVWRMGKDSVVFDVAPEGFRLSEVSVRLAKPEERPRWDERMDRHHYLGFKRFAGRGLRYVFE